MTVIQSWEKEIYLESLKHPLASPCLERIVSIVSALSSWLFPPHHEDPTKHSFATGDTKQRWRNLSMVNGSWSRTRTDDTLCIFPFLASMGKSLKEKWIHVEFTLHQALYQRDTTSHPCSWEQRLQSTRLARIQVFVTTRESSKCPSS